MSQCAPGFQDGSNTCFTYLQLKNIAKQYNKTQNQKKNQIIIHRDKTRLWNIINNKLKYKCNDEKCWVDNPNHSINIRFRPNHPENWNTNPREWLSNVDIQKVMEQYENKFNTFKFMGVFPNDYDYKLSTNKCVAEELCNLNVKELLQNKKKQLGIIFNIDPHYASGSHWVAVYIGLSKTLPNNKFGFYYYDSNAEKPTEYVYRLFNSIKDQLNLKEFDMYTNDVRHQYKNTECGIFSIDFLVNMLDRSKSFKSIINDGKTDDKMFEKRKIYFYQNKSKK
jgi:hypothetical protein